MSKKVELFNQKVSSDFKNLVSQSFDGLSQDELYSINSYFMLFLSSVTVLLFKISTKDIKKNIITEESLKKFSDDYGNILSDYILQGLKEFIINRDSEKDFDKKFLEKVEKEASARKMRTWKDLLFDIIKH